MRTRMRCLAAGVLAGFCLNAWAADSIVIYNKNEAKYFVDLLREALEHTKDEGAYTLKSTDTAIGTARAIDEVADNTGALSIFTRGSNIEEEKRLLPVRIPLDRGLLGYRILIVRKQDLPKFAAIQSVDELKRLRAGQGSHWPDAKILESAGFTMSNGYYPAGLLRMLNEERFDMFPRATWEAYDGIRDAKAQGLDDLVVEPTLAVHYPYPRYYMVSPKGNGPALAARVEKGLRRMMADGSFDKMFNANFGPALEASKLRERRIFKVDNKLLPPETPFAEKALWFSMAPDEPAKTTPASHTKARP